MEIVTFHLVVPDSKQSDRPRVVGQMAIQNHVLSPTELICTRYFTTEMQLLLERIQTEGPPTIHSTPLDPTTTKKRCQLLSKISNPWHKIRF